MRLNFLINEVVNAGQPMVVTRWQPTVETGRHSIERLCTPAISDGKRLSNNCHESAASNDTGEDKQHAVSRSKSAAIDVAGGCELCDRTAEKNVKPTPSAALLSLTCRTNQDLDGIIFFIGMGPYNIKLHTV